MTTKIVFDLDYTLLDTVKFKEALVVATGVDEKAYEAAYAAAVARNKGLFDPAVLFAELKERALLTGQDVAPARERFDAVLTTTEQYLYPQAKEMLESLRRHPEAKVELMTFGNAEWQKAKVEHSGLKDLFHDVLYAEKDKKEFVRNLREGDEKVVIVNDNGKEMEEMMNAAPEYAYIIKKGPKAIPEDLRLPTAETIEALAALLERETGWELRGEMKELRRETKEWEARMVAPGEEVRGEVDMGGDEKEEREPPREIHGGSARL